MMLELATSAITASWFSFVKYDTFLIFFARRSPWLFEACTSFFAFDLGAGEDDCSLNHRSSYRFPDTWARRELLAFPVSPWHSHRFPDAWRKLQDSPFEHVPFAFNWNHSPTFCSTKGLCPSWPFETAPLSTTSFWILKFLFLRVRLTIMQFHTHSQSVIVGFSSTSSNFLVVQWQRCLKLRWIL